MNINGLNIMATLISVYFEYIKFSCKIFTKYIMPILQVYPTILLYVLKLLKITIIIIIIIIIIYLY